MTGLLPFIIVLPPLAYSLLSLFCAAPFFRRHNCSAGSHGEAAPVTILKPVKGVDAESFENFASFCRQDYSEFQIVFAAASADDPVVPVIRRLMAEFPDRDIDLVIDGRIYGPNYKVCNLINAFPRAKHDILIVCDSDIRVGTRFLQEVCASFADPQVGLVTSLYRTRGVHGAATAIEALGFTTEMVPNVMVARRLEGLSFALGASMAVRREALEAIGGFPALVDYLADDYQLGNKVHRAGYRLELSDYWVESIMHRESLDSVLSRQLRWARTMRVSRPGGYFASGITQPAPAALLALLLEYGSATAWGAVILLYFVRSIVSLVYSRRFVRDGLLPRYLWLLPLRDLLSFGTWALSFLGSRVRWRGHLFRVLPGGKLTEAE
ncbi:bacteriohopanetetrol glucosamine biosynthesis glycosyltransferase HpnI [Geobacter sp. DSM 9736]|uniref:bacteriohopanetetrol glucosamine biosynthesis glycosyltransferase HpnI n=1 Tax=Geobacter sp. DSM 9736 TaxID=1277350 RepID=UPI000B505B5A|nr:bacteriohopanetetrol glucosamine biosynthesis glycosyltransferase HpnI [Geobacter sp. DSM 9736]SNB46517.1 ceramide glucosyltransferase [Geobacter sp. DSM 9736]